MRKVNAIKSILFVLTSLSLLIFLGLIMTRPFSPSLEGLEASIGHKSYTKFLIETFIKTILASCVTGIINYSLFRNVANKLIKWKPFWVILLIHFLVGFAGCIPYIKMVYNSLYKI